MGHNRQMTKFYWGAMLSEESIHVIVYLDRSLGFYCPDIAFDRNAFSFALLPRGFPI